MLRKVRKDTNLHSETDDQSIFWLLLWGQHCSNLSKIDRKSNSGKKIHKIQNSLTSVSAAAAAAAATAFSSSSSRINLPISSSSLQSDIDDLSQYILVENITNESNSSNDDENNSDSARSLSIVCCGQNCELQFSLDHLKITGLRREKNTTSFFQIPIAQIKLLKLPSWTLFFILIRSLAIFFSLLLIKGRKYWISWERNPGLFLVWKKLNFFFFPD